MTISSSENRLYSKNLQSPESLPAEQLTLTPEDYSLLTDLYELTMTACYVGEGLEQRRGKL